MIEHELLEVVSVLDGVSMKPRAVIVAGPNGAGKTTFAMEYLGNNDLIYLSADAIAEGLSPGNIDEYRIEAGREFLRRTTKHIDKQDNILIETTLSGLGFKRFTSSMIEKGYSTTLVFVYLASADACIQRVLERTRKGGQFIPPIDVERRFYRSLNNFWHVYRHLVNRWALCYNTSELFVDVASGIENDFAVTDDHRYQMFLRSMERR